jgi:uncharacterized Fe-S cluster-containing radical SAM superfamily protein
LNGRDTSTTISGDLIITRLTGKINLNDVNDWFIGFEQSCQQFINNHLKYKLLIDRKGYTPDHFSVQKQWKEKFFNESILIQCKAMVFLLEEGEIMNQLKQSNTKESVEFFSNYADSIDWLNAYPI